MTDPNLQTLDDSGPTLDGDRLLALYPLYLTYAEEIIKKHFSLVPPSSKEEEETIRAAMAPVSFERFPKLLTDLGEDRYHYEKCWELGYEAAKGYVENEPPPGVRKFVQMIVDAFASAEARHKRLDRPEGEGGHRR